jgi:hypothetical protein
VEFPAAELAGPNFILKIGLLNLAGVLSFLEMGLLILAGAIPA